MLAAETDPLPPFVSGLWNVPQLCTRTRQRADVALTDGERNVEFESFELHFFEPISVAVYHGRQRRLKYSRGVAAGLAQVEEL